MVAGTRYSAVAIALHWLTALSIFLLIPMGWWMIAAIAEPSTQLQAYRMFQVHKALGFLVLALTLIRIVWRLGHRPPPLPDGMKRWEVFAARATHAAFYALLLVLPLSGWVYVSAGWAVAEDQALEVATSWFGLFPIPHIGPVAGLAEEARRTVAFRANGAHQLLSWGVVALITLHVGAALKHRIINRDTVLASILPWTKRNAIASAKEREERWPALLACLALTATLVVTGATMPTLPPRQIAAQSNHAIGPGATADRPIVAGTATAWTVDPSASAIRFFGTHAGADFTGRFADWKASIWFDPADLPGSKAFVDVSTGSARTLDATQESSLKGAEWFDPVRHPTARFEASTFRVLGGNRYEAIGTLRVKVVSIPVILRFTFSEEGGVATVKGQLTLDRIALDLGLVSDAAAYWVSKDIKVEIQVSARKSS
jgi:cytochrome b561/polyisoprenoid-binding protein YceI